MSHIAPTSSPTQRALAVALTASHLAAGGAVLLLVSGAPMPLSAPSILSALALAALVGLVVSAPLSRALSIAALALDQIARGNPPVTVPNVRWPLTPVLRQIGALARRDRELAATRARAERQIQEIARESERTRLAQDLHDALKQQLYRTSLSLATAQARWDADPAGARAALVAAQQAVKEAEEEVRSLMLQAAPAPLERQSFADAVRTVATSLGYRTGARVTTDITPSIDPALLPEGALPELFYIVQEACANVSRHARATTVQIRVAADDAALMLTIADDGQGFDPHAPTSGFGLESMRERAARLDGTGEVMSAVGKGTEVRVRVPLLPPDVLEDTSPLPETLRQLRRTALLRQLIGGGLALTTLATLTIVWQAWASASLPIAWTGGIFILSLATAAGSLVLGYWRSRLAADEFRLAVTSDDPQLLAFTRDQHQVQAMVALAALWVVPAVALGWLGYAPWREQDSDTRPLIALWVALLALLAYEGWRFFQASNQHYQRLTPRAAREAFLREQLATEVSPFWRRLSALVTIVITAYGIVAALIGTLAYALTGRTLDSAVFTQVLWLLGTWAVVLVVEAIERRHARRWERRLTEADKETR